MNEAAKMTTMRPNGAKLADAGLLDLHDRIARVRDMVALARVATMPIAGEGDADAVNGLGWVMHLAQEEADHALSDLDTIMREYPV